MTHDGYGFNWGAFWFGPFYLGGHKKYGLMILTLLFMCIPIFNIIWMFICGVKGSEWVSNRCALNESEFRASMSTWNRGGAIFTFLIFIPVILGIILAVAIPGIALHSSKSNNSDTQNYLQELYNNPAIQKLLKESNVK